MAGRSAILSIKILTDARNAQAGLANTGTALDKLGKKSKVAGAVVAAGLAVAATAVAGFAISAVKAASDLSETVSKSQVIFGKSSVAVEKFAKSAANSFGISQQSALDAAATFGTFGKSAGKSGADLAKFSTDLVGTAADMASFANTTPEDAITALSAALRGENEPIRKYQVLLDDATLRQEALRLGLIKTTKTALTPQQKVLAAHAAIYKQLGDQQGDFGRTQGSMANMLRRVSSQFANIKLVIGQALLPVAIVLLGVLLKLIPVFQTVGTTLAASLGPPVKQVTEMLAGMLPALQATGAQFLALLPSIVSAGKTLATALLPVLAGVVNIITTTLLPTLATLAAIFITKVLPPILALVKVIAAKLMPIIASVARIITAVAVPVFKVIATVVGVLANVLAKNLGPALDAIKPLFDKMEAAIAKNKPTIDKITAVLQGLAHVLGDVLGWTIKNIVVPQIKFMVGAISTGIDIFSKFLDLIGSLIDKVKELVHWFSQIKVPKISLPHIPDFNPFSAAAPAGLSPAGATRMGARSVRAAGATTGTGGIVVNVYGVLDGADAARKIRAVLRGDDRRRAGIRVNGHGNRID
jgi:hypothetical protein